MMCEKPFQYEMEKGFLKLWSWGAVQHPSPVAGPEYLWLQ